MKNIKLGSQGLIIPQIGLGCMTMTAFAGNDVYGPLTNEKLIAKAIKGQRHEYIIASKFGEEVNDQEQFTKNLKLLYEIENVAKEKAITTAQLAIAWIIAKGYVPIPGTKKRKYVEQNIEATQINLSQQDLQRLDTIIPLETFTRLRYSEAIMKHIDMQ
jgi:aryl-alcohol dehydrogenase-like predicted oxidoreductase